MQKPNLQTILISILIIIALFTSIYFPYKYKQLSNDFLDQTNQYGELLKQINDLQKEVRELKNRDREVDDLPDENLEAEEKDKPEEIIPSLEIDTSDWETYRNEEYGFEIKYPKDWHLKRFNENFVSFIAPGRERGIKFPGDITIHISNNSSKLNIKEFYDGKNGGVNLFTGTKNITIISIDGITGMKFTGVQGLTSSTVTVIPLDNLFVEIEDVVEYYQKNGIYNQILSTFRFINPVADYLRNAELQCKNNSQMENIADALNDILTLSEEQLKVKKYKDSTGKENQWDLHTLIYRHFVPEYPGVALGNNFFHDVKLEESQKQVKEILEKDF